MLRAEVASEDGAQGREEGVFIQFERFVKWRLVPVCQSLWRSEVSGANKVACEGKTYRVVGDHNLARLCDAIHALQPLLPPILIHPHKHNLPRQVLSTLLCTQLLPLHADLGRITRQELVLREVI